MDFAVFDIGLDTDDVVIIRRKTTLLQSDTANTDKKQKQVENNITFFDILVYTFFS